MNPLRMSPNTSKFLSSSITSIIISDDTCILSVQKKLCCIYNNETASKSSAHRGEKQTDANMAHYYFS